MSQIPPNVEIDRKTTIDWSSFIELLRDKQRIMLTAHIRPDCDALGSEIGLAAILRRSGKEVHIVHPFDLPPQLTFLDPDGQAKRLGVDVSTAEIESYDLLVVLDTSAWSQLGEMADVFRQTSVPKAVIDHHVSGNDLNALELKDSTAEATGRLVVEAADALDVPLDAEIARPLFAALATDTGWFRFSNTSARTYRLAARLVAAGADPDRIYRTIFENDSMARLRLVGRAISQTECELDGRLAYTHLEQSDFRELGALPGDSENIVNRLLAVCQTEVAFLMVEQQTGGFRINFRSACDVDCSQIAEQFGGGGHRKAAGAFVPGSFDEARSKILDVVRTAMR